MIGDLTGESLILKLLQKLLQFKARFSLIEDTEDSFNGVILMVGRRDLPYFEESVQKTLTVHFGVYYSFPFSCYHIVNVRELPSSVKRTSYRL